MKPIVAASSHVVGNKDVDKGEDFYGHMQNNLSDCMLKFPWMNPRDSEPHIWCLLASCTALSSVFGSFVVICLQCWPLTLSLFLLHRKPEHFSSTHEKVWAEPQCWGPSSCDLTSCRAESLVNVHAVFTFSYVRSSGSPSSVLYFDFLLHCKALLLFSTRFGHTSFFVLKSVK